jgi:hypothetical protein
MFGALNHISSLTSLITIGLDVSFRLYDSANKNFTSGLVPIVDLALIISVVNRRLTAEGPISI